jgi:hypothetical protein
MPNARDIICGRLRPPTIAVGVGVTAALAPPLTLSARAAAAAFGSVVTASCGCSCSMPSVVGAAPSSASKLSAPPLILRAVASRALRACKGEPRIRAPKV